MEITEKMKQEGLKQEGVELSDEQLDEVAGGVGGGSHLSSRTITIKITYSEYDSRRRVREALLEEMRKQNIPTDQVPSAASLWYKGMTAGCKSGTLVYVCDETGRQISCYKG